MKLLFSILSFIICATVFGQSNTYINGSNIYLRNPGGKAHVYTQGTHNVSDTLYGVGAIFTDSIYNNLLLPLNDSSNKLPTTKWVKQQNFSGGGGTPSLPNNSVQFNRNGVFTGSDTMLFNNSSLILGKQDSAGSRLSYAWNTNPLGSPWTNHLTTTSITTGGSNTNFNGGTFDLNNSISSSEYIGAENWTLTDTVIQVTLNHTSFGISYFFSASTGMGQAVFVHFLLSDTAGYIAYTNGQSLPDGNSINNKNSVNFQRVAGDTLLVKIQKLRRVLFISLKNKRTGVETKLTVNDVDPTVGQPSMYFYGGSWTFFNKYNIQYNELRHPAVAGFGNSIEHGGIANNYNSKWFSIATTNLRGGYSLMAASTEASINGTYREGDLAFITPQILLYAYGVNDHNGSVPLATYSANVVNVVEYCLAHGIRIILVNCVPQSSSSVVTYNDTLQAIATRYSLDAVINIYSALVASAGTAMNSIYNSGDGIHPNQLGHNVIGEMVRAAIAPYVTFNSPLIANLPVTNNNRLLSVVADDHNRLWTLPFTPDSAYVNIVTTPTAQNVQAGGFNLGGKLWGGTELRVAGNGAVQTNPDFSVNTNGDSYTTSILFHSRNFSTTSNGSSQFDGTGGGDIQKVLFVGGAYIWGYQQPVMIKTAYPQAASVGVILDNGTEQSVTSSYHIEEFKQSGTTQAWIDRAGGYRTDTTSGYNSNIDGLITGLDWITKDYADSAYGGGGGSSLFPLTGTGTATGDVTGDLGVNNFTVGGQNGNLVTSLSMNTSNGGINLTNQDLSSGAQEQLTIDFDGGMYIKNDNGSGTSSTATFTSHGWEGQSATDTVNYTGNSLPTADYVNNHINTVVSSLVTVYKASATLNFGSTSASSSSDLTVTVTGASVGDPVAIGLPSSPDANSCYTAFVSASNTVTIRFNNYQSIGAIDPASGTFKITVFKY